MSNKGNPYSQILTNFVSLIFLQGTNLLIPILIVPYLIKTLGIDRYGIVSLAQTTAIYFYIMVDYGFSLSAVRELSSNKENPNRVSEIFTEVFFTKSVLLVISFIILSVLVWIHPKFRENWELFLLSFSLVIGQMLMPIWFFQGMDSMKYSTYANIVAKIFFVGLIFLYIKKSDDAYLVNPLLGLGNIVAGICSTIFIIRKYNIVFIFKGLKVRIICQLREGFNYFISNFSASVYMNSNIVILGLFVTNHQLGIFSIAEKIVLLIRQLLVVFSQAVYTYMCSISEDDSSKKMKHFFRNIYLPFLVLIIVGCLILFSNANMISEYFSMVEEDSRVLVQFIHLMSFVPVVVCLNIPFYQILLIHDNGKKGSRLLFAGALFAILLNFLFTPYWGGIGACFSIMCTELAITTGVIILVEKSPKIAILRNAYK